MLQLGTRRFDGRNKLFVILRVWSVGAHPPAAEHARTRTDDATRAALWENGFAKGTDAESPTVSGPDQALDLARIAWSRKAAYYVRGRVATRWRRCRCTLTKVDPTQRSTY